MHRLTACLPLRSAFRSFSQSRARLLITGSGRDRLGIIRDLSGLVWAGQGNILDSCMTRLAGQFVVMMLAEVPAETSIDLQFELAKHKNLQGLNLTVKPVDDSFQRSEECGSRTLKLVVEGADHPGVLHQIADILSSHNVNIKDLTTSFEPAPLGGTLLFHLHGYIQLHPKTDVEQVRAELLKASSSLGIEVTLSQT